MHSPSPTFGFISEICSTSPCRIRNRLLSRSIPRLRRYVVTSVALLALLLIKYLLELFWYATRLIITCEFGTIVKLGPIHHPHPPVALSVDDILKMHRHTSKLAGCYMGAVVNQLGNLRLRRPLQTPLASDEVSTRAFQTQTAAHLSRLTFRFHSVRQWQ